jgi:phosphohistidine phosphatase
MELYLVRHGDAVGKDINPECPLSDYGFSEINKTIDYIIKNKEIASSEIYHSGKMRARQTAEIIGNYLTITVKIKQAKGLKPMDNPENWVENINQRQNNLIIVSHLPLLGNLASGLLKTDSEIQFDTGTFVCLSNSEENRWKLKWIISPSDTK